jgi:hypothetical protein
MRSGEQLHKHFLIFAAYHAGAQRYFEQLHAAKQCSRWPSVTRIFQRLLRETNFKLIQFSGLSKVLA